jgi:TetR/AcrR family transcriptional regulator, transcriptional repressor for nem operon
MGAIETRRPIIEAADRLFCEHGFEATFFADIAAEVKLSRRTDERVAFLSCER